MSMRFLKYVAGIALAMLMTACGGGGGNASTPVAVTGATTSVAAILINPSASGSLNADGSSTKTFYVYALTSGNASVLGATINLAATNGVILDNSSVVTTATGANGSVGATVTMTAVSSDQTNRTSVLTASCSSCSASSATSAVSVVGASIALTTPDGTSAVVSGTAPILRATVRDVNGLAMSGVPVSFASSNPVVLGVSASVSMTGSDGVAYVTVSGLSAGTTTINVSALGKAASQAFTSGVATSVLAVTSPVNNTVINTAKPQSISVSAVGASSVTFTTTLGVFSVSGSASQTVSTSGGVASADLTSSQAGTASVTVSDNLLRSVNLTLLISPPVSSVNKVLLNASQTTLPISTSTNTASVTLTARAIAFNGTSDQSVANVPIEFSMAGGPGAGEYLTPALAYTNSAGIAVATFTAGTSASVANGIVVSAKVQGTAVQTGISPSSSSALLTIGGQALSVAFGPSTVLDESADKTLYIQTYSVQVADANNNPVAGQKVTLRLRPVAFSTGSACTVAATYCSEDVNANSSLEASTEDGVRVATTASTAGSCPITAPVSTGTLDGILTPQNSDGGSVPSTVTTGADGTASFNFTYLKGSALWLINKLTATVSSNGTETSRSTIFRLPALEADTTPKCYLPPSPYNF